jgi:SAM-dependent methyltransferase
MVFNRTPQQLRRGVERRLETFIYQFGDEVQCCYCGWSGSRFLPAGQRRVPNRLCPRCSSLQRHRMLYLYMAQHTPLLQKPVRLLDVAPKPCFTELCRRLPNVSYISSDLMTQGAMVFSDLTRMGMASSSFDIIVCLHVMEHIPDDRAAYAEIRRLLKPDGFGLIMVPIEGEQTFEDPDARPEDYDRLYGQHDHVRLCGLDIVDRMREVGLQTETLDMFELFGPEVRRTHALDGDDRYFFCVTRNDAEARGKASATAD